MGFLYITIAGLTISIVGGLFWTLVVYGLFWKKGIQGKLLHKTSEPSLGTVGYKPQNIPATPESAPKDAQKLENPIEPETKQEA
jgi:hypothetical protein